MIIGNGLIASAFMNATLDPETIVFASGVSNSSETNPAAFRREKGLLNDAMRMGRPIWYFSTCSITEAALLPSLYVKHKEEIEETLTKFGQATIFRLPQVVGRTKNLHTLTNYLYAKVCNGEPFSVWSTASRSLIDVEDVVRLAMYFGKRISTNRNVFELATGKLTTVLELVQLFEKILQKKATYTLVRAGGHAVIDAQEAQQAASVIGLQWDSAYVETTLRKYYDCR